MKSSFDSSLSTDSTEIRKRPRSFEIQWRWMLSLLLHHHRPASLLYCYWFHLEIGKKSAEGNRIGSFYFFFSCSFSRQKISPTQRQDHVVSFWPFFLFVLFQLCWVLARHFCGWQPHVTPLKPGGLLHTRVWYFLWTKWSIITHETPLFLSLENSPNRRFHFIQYIFSSVLLDISMFLFAVGKKRYLSWKQCFSVKIYRLASKFERPHCSHNRLVSWLGVNQSLTSKAGKKR